MSSSFFLSLFFLFILHHIIFVFKLYHNYPNPLSYIVTKLCETSTKIMHNNSQICSNLKKKCFIYNIIRTQKERNFHNITHLVQPKSTASIKNSCHIQPSNTANRNFVLFVNSLNPPCTQNKIIENPLIVSYSSRPHLCCRLSPHYSMIRSSHLTLSSLKSPTPTPYSDSFPPTPHDLCNPTRQK